MGRICTAVGRICTLDRLGPVDKVGTVGKLGRIGTVGSVGTVRSAFVEHIAPNSRESHKSRTARSSSVDQMFLPLFSFVVNITRYLRNIMLHPPAF